MFGNNTGVNVYTVWGLGTATPPKLHQFVGKVRRAEFVRFGINLCAHNIVISALSVYFTTFVHI